MEGLKPDQTLRNQQVSGSIPEGGSISFRYFRFSSPSLPLVRSDADAPRLDGAHRNRLLPAFDHGSGHGLLLLGAGEVGTPCPRYSFCLEFGAREVTALFSQGPQTAGGREQAAAAGGEVAPGRIASSCGTWTSRAGVALAPLVSVGRATVKRGCGGAARAVVEFRRPSPI